MSQDEGPLGKEDEALLRILRAGTRKQGDEVALVDEETLTAYVMGTANQAESAAVQDALHRSPELRRQVLDLMQGAETPSTAEERRTFDRTTPPSTVRNPQMAALVKAMGSPTAAAVRKIAWGRSSRRGWLEWALGGWAVTATVAACALFVLISRTAPPSVATVPPGTQVSPGVTGGTNASGGLESPRSQQPQPLFAIVVLETIRLRGPSRGVGSDTVATYPVSPSTRIIQLSAEPPDVPDGSRVRMTLIGPDGKLLIEETRPVEDFSHSRTLALQSQQEFQPGRYVLTIAGRRGNTIEQIRYPFVIRVDAG